MTVELERLPPQTREKVEELMRTNGWGFSRAMNEMFEAAVAGGALSVVGRRKATVLKLVAPKRASGRDS